MDLLINNVILNDKKTNILIQDGIITKIAEDMNADNPKTEILDACEMTAIPSFVNTHTHAAMTLLRGYGDDMPLMQWLENKIWPAESKLTGEDIYWGTKMACLEMIKSGTTAFGEMYWHIEDAAKAVQEMGLRCLLGGTFVTLGGKNDKETVARLERQYEWSKTLHRRIRFALAPHAVYTVSQQLLHWAGEFAKENNLFIHMHLSETRKEYDDCLKLCGNKPAFYLDKAGILTDKTILAHCVWLDDDEIECLSQRGVSVSHNPISNLKLAVGKIMPYETMKALGLNVTLGTDGCASNNNLNMFETMKFAALIQKYNADNCSILPAEECFLAATINGAKALGLKSGRIEQGSPADLLLINRNTIEMTPGYNLYSDLVYAASKECIDTVICDGQVLMRNQIVPQEEEILAKAREISNKMR